MSVYSISSHNIDKLPKPGTPGGWLASDLQDVAADLNAGDGDARREHTRSVPDAWAQVLIARDALFDPRDALHRDIQGQWRALLATVALAPFCKNLYSLSVLPITASVGALAKLLLDPVLAPKSTIADASDWGNSVAAIQLTLMGKARTTAGAQTIGLAVPDILLAPGRGFSGLRVPGVAWLEDGPVDPLEVAMSPMYLAVLAKFAGDLASAAQALPAGRADTMAQRQLLVNGLTALAGACSQKATGHWPTRRGDSSGLAWPSPLGAVLAVPPLIVSDPAAGESDCRLKVRDDLGPLSFVSIILADPSLASPARPAHMIRLFDIYSLADAAEQMPQIKEAAAQHGHVILGVDDLLTNVLVAQVKGTMPGHGGAASGYFLPVTPLMLLLKSGNALASAAIVRPHGAGVQAGVKLEMADGGVHELVRSYAGETLRSVERLSNFGVWPNFVSEHWRHYGVRAKSSPALEPCLVLAGSGRVIAADLAGSPRARQRALIDDWAKLRRLDRTREQSLGAAPATLVQFPLSDPADTNQSSLQAWSSVPVEALFMTLHGAAAGCVVPPLTALQPPLMAQRAVVAIDFGTSNSIVRWMRDGVAQDARQLKNRVVQPIAPSPGSEDYDLGVRSDFADFLPTADQTMPFPTMIRERALPRDVTAEVACTYQSIFFADAGIQGGDVSTLLSWIDGNTIQANIKWDDTPIGKQRSTRFLRQLVMMIGAELMEAGLSPGQIAWRFSYPSAFLPTQQQDFRDLIGAAVADINGSQDARVDFYSEAIAAKQALAVEGAIQSTGSLIVMLDIGGGTTDIALWKGSETLWQGSYRIAARSFFTDSLVRYPAILDATGALDAAATRELRGWAADQAHGGAETLKARNLVELTIGQPGFDERFRRAMRLNGGVAEWRALQAAAMTALGGILWYVGRLIKTRSAEGIWPLDAADLASTRIALAGRGASYFQHLDPGGEVVLPKLLAMLTIAAGEADGVPGVYFSKTPKQEVVDGLLLLNVPSGIADRTLSTAILGESLSYGDRAWPAEADLGAVEMPQVSPDIGLAETRAFIAALKSQVGVDIDLARRTPGGNLQGAVMTAMKAPFRVQKPGSTIETPLFILGLAALVDEMVRS